MRPSVVCVRVRPNLLQMLELSTSDIESGFEDDPEPLPATPDHLKNADGTYAADAKRWFLQYVQWARKQQPSAKLWAISQAHSRRRGGCVPSSSVQKRPRWPGSC